jgi:hypothetical protein
MNSAGTGRVLFRAAATRPDETGVGMLTRLRVAASVCKPNHPMNGPSIA